MEHPVDLMDLFDKVLLPVENPYFEARHAYWREKNKQNKEKAV